MNASTVVQKVWNYCNLLRGDGRREGLDEFAKSSSKKRSVRHVVAWQAHQIEKRL